MKSSPINEIADALLSDLQAFAGVCKEILSLATLEHQALASEVDYQAPEFNQRRRTLLSDIESLLQKFRSRRLVWQQIPHSQREQFKDLNLLFEGIQGLLTRVISLDRENQQAMLKRGLVPAQHLPGTTGQQLHYVEHLYRRNSLI